MEIENTLDITGEGLYQHQVSDDRCTAGWCGGIGCYPTPCNQTGGCIGLIHADFGEESGDSYTLATRCDICGESE